MLRWLATLSILLLLAVDLVLPSTMLGRRGTSDEARADIEAMAGRLGERLPDFELPDLDGNRVRLSSLRGHRVLLVFERSADW